MQPAGQSPQPIVILIAKPSVVASPSHQAFAPMRFGSYFVTPLKRASEAMTTAAASSTLATGLPIGVGVGPPLGVGLLLGVGDSLPEPPPGPHAASRNAARGRSRAERRRACMRLGRS